MAALLAVGFAWPGLSPAAWGLFGLSGVAAMVTGTVVNRPAHRAPWLLLTAAALCLVIGQTALLVITATLHETVKVPSWLDGFYLATYPLSAAGLLIFVRWRTSGRDRRSLLDALTLTVGLALLSWIYLIEPYTGNPGLSWVQQAFAIAYPLGDVLLLAVIARLIAPGSARSRPVQLLALGTVGVLASDVAYGLIQLHGTFRPGTAVDLGWALFYLAWAAAALHPDMARLTDPVPRQHARTSGPRLILLMLASLIAPVVLFIQSATGRHEGMIIAAFSAILYLLVITRLADSAATNRRALGRERELRLAGLSLAAASGVDDVARAVRGTVATLAGAHLTRGALLVVRARAGFREAGLAPGYPGVPAGHLAALLEPRLAALAESGPQLVHARELTGGEAAKLAGADSVLLCPLALTDHPEGDPLLGVLIVLGEERYLAALSGTLEILAGQAVLAMERIRLSREVSRRDSDAYFRTLVQDTSDTILIIEEDGRIRYATPSAAALFGDVSLEGQLLAEVVNPAEREDVMRVFTSMRDHVGERPHEDLRLTGRDESEVDVEVKCSDLRQDPTVAGLVFTLRDVTEQRKLERELKYRAFHDALTGLPNRLLFSERIAQALARARRSHSTMGVLFIDLDDFKLVNDTMGHGIGDELLVAAGNRLAGLVRETDTAARLGGDEFALLVEDAPSSASVEKFAVQIIQAFGEPFPLTTGSVLTTATIGVATTEDSSDAGDLVRHADLALYAAKAAGKRQWRRYQPVLSVGMTKRRELQAAIDEAIETSAFTLVYQPIVALASDEVVGFEALVRWPHPRWGMLHPDQFITLAEETGHIVPLGSWVLRRAVADMVRLQRRLPRRPPLYVSVNVSARQFANPGFVAEVRRVVSAAGLAPSALVLELTESVLLHRDDRIRADLTELKNIGVKLAIDDFGTGYSSLGYLRELPMDVLKIDRSFVEGMAVSEQRLAIVEIILRIAKTLGMAVIAEGIESEVQRDLLISLGCEFGQGYLLDRPVAAGETEALVRARWVPRLGAVPTT
jgi:diguanylate cyclase (GGDEF)-like protein/PAS domain S-box-containing protein